MYRDKPVKKKDIGFKDRVGEVSEEANDRIISNWSLLLAFFWLLIHIFKNTQ
jgi:hypothetical protein